MTLSQLRGHLLAKRIVQHQLAGGEYDEETGDFIPIPRLPRQQSEE
jgi:hypothetical protein